MEHTAAQQRISRVLQWMGDVTSRSGAAAIVLILLLAFGTLLTVDGFPGNWEVGFATLVGSINLLMLFVIQHTQSRHQAVLQMKLDELIRSSPNADGLFVHIEVAQDAELIQREQGHLAHHESLRGQDELEIIEFLKD